MAVYRPPGNLNDFDAIVGQREKWHEYVQRAVRNAIHQQEDDLAASQGGNAEVVAQFYDAFAESVGEVVEQEIVWNAFPNELLRRFGRADALRLADTLWPLSADKLGWMYDPRRPPLSADELAKLPLSVQPSASPFSYRPQTEYCEWHVQSTGMGGIQRVTFTCEPPDYWKAMFGGTYPGSSVEFPGSKEVVLHLYQHLVDARIELKDILFTPETGSAVGAIDTPLGTVLGGRYNPYNRWNTRFGIAHMCARPNALLPEITLAATASRVFRNARDDTVVLPDVLVAGAAELGNANRNSDVAIAATVNALARQGRRITLSDPVGIYIDHVDLAGWECPGGWSPRDCIRIVRGHEGQALRLVVEMPDPRFAVSDIRIGGEPLRYGGQIAECITMKLRAAATVASGIANARFPLTVPAAVCPKGGRELFSVKEGGLPPPEGTVCAFAHEANPPGGLAARPAERREDLDEPVLNLGQIQGIAVPGFLKPHQTLLCVHHDHHETQVRKVKNFLSSLVPQLSSSMAAMKDRQRFRESAPSSGALMAIGFSWPGLLCLTETAQAIRSPAFRQGMPARSALLGDATRFGDPGHPSSWVVGGPGLVPDFMIVIAGQDRTEVNVRTEELTARLTAAGCSVQRQDGDKLDKAEKSREHFGFVDGISQPGIRGRMSGAPSAFITPSSIAEWPASGLYGYPGQDLVWPGEFVLGYARSGPDPLLPGPLAEPDVWWMKNGSYLVYNRLVQDVGLFWKTMADEAERLSSQPGFEKINAEGLASHLVGRTRNGVPVSRLQGASLDLHEDMGSEALANNNFRFDADTPRLALVDGSDAYPSARADPLGRVCPLAAHIRKVNPRDSASDVGGESANLQHRILRVGVSFGPRREHLKAAPSAGEPERGQLFLCIQSSIEAQFEFLQARWMNDGMRPKSPGGHDMLAGRHPSSGGERRCAIFGADGQAQEVRASKPFVTSSGGGYFFVPSLDAIANVLAAQ